MSSEFRNGYDAGYEAGTRRAITDQTATLLTLVEIIDDPEFDAADPECVRDLVQYISVQCRAVCGGAT